MNVNLTAKLSKATLKYIKGELHSNYIFLHIALIGLEWDSTTLFTKMSFFSFQNSHFITI